MLLPVGVFSRAAAETLPIVPTAEPTTDSVLPALGDVGSFLSGLAAAAALILAIRGFQSWRRELRGTTKFHAARKVLLSLYRLHVQTSLTRSASGTVENEGPAFPNREQLFLAWRAEYLRRLERLERAHRSLHVAALELKALGEIKVLDHLEEVFKKAALLRITAPTHFELALLEIRAEERPSKDTIETHKILYGSNDDAFGTELAHAVETAEQWLLTFIR